jgi:hypothetical protein
MAAVSSRRGNRSRAIPRPEILETRRLMAVTAQPTAAEQLFLEQLNNARANPAAYGASIGVDLSGVAPSQPLAFDPILVNEAQSHSSDMINRNYFSSNTPEGVTPVQRVVSSGFPIKNRRNPSKWVVGAIYQLTYTGDDLPDASLQTLADNAPGALSALITDQGVADLHHRLHLLAVPPFSDPSLRLVGIGAAGAQTAAMTTLDYSIDIAAPASKDANLTGVVFNDANRNGSYDIGEGLGGVTISAAGKKGHGSTTTFASGGYSLPLPKGTYTVTASGGGLAHAMTQSVTIGTLNVRLDVTAS